MSAELKNETKFYENANHLEASSKKTNLVDLMSRLKKEKKEERKSNLILSAAAVSAVTVFGIILTL
jgi:hypothetical protein